MQELPLKLATESGRHGRSNGRQPEPQRVLEYIDNHHGSFRLAQQCKLEVVPERDAIAGTTHGLPTFMRPAEVRIEVCWEGIPILRCARSNDVGLLCAACHSGATR